MLRDEDYWGVHVVSVRVSKILSGSVLLGSVLLLSGAGYQVVATQRDKRKYRNSGEFVDVGGHRLHLRVAGEDRGLPTVVMENGLGFPSLTWTWVQREVARYTRVVAYDRAGTGWSEFGPEPRDARRLVEELHAALCAESLSGPYVLVAHSLGGLLARVFADRYAEEVAGMVLVDSSHPDEFERSPSQRRGLPKVKQMVKLFRLLAHLGVLRLGFLTVGWLRDFPPDQGAELRSLLA